jgi:AAA ATPase domain
VQAWAALRASSAKGRFEALRATDLTALVGREEELELLLQRWSKAKSGEGQVVLLSGEAGIGKIAAHSCAARTARNRAACALALFLLAAIADALNARGIDPLMLHPALGEGDYASNESAFNRAVILPD